jgi:hypothetical protein
LKFHNTARDYQLVNLYYINETSGKEFSTDVECTHQLPYHRCLLAIRSFRVSYLKPSDEALCPIMVVELSHHRNKGSIKFKNCSCYSQSNLLGLMMLLLLISAPRRYCSTSIKIVCCHYGAIYIPKFLSLA